MSNQFPADILARAKARGLKLDTQRGEYRLLRGKQVQFTTRELPELRRWLSSSESLPIRTV